MENLEHYEKLQKEGILHKDDYYRQAFARNIGLLTEEEQVRISRAKVAIPGLGGVGGLHLMALVRMGVGHFKLADFDVYDPVNINRQSGAKVSSFGRPKLDCLREEALDINPYLKIDSFSQGVTTDNLNDFLQDVDVVLDGLDFFQIHIRRLVFNTARSKGIPVITAGPLGFSSALLVFLPDTGMGFDQYFNITDQMSEEEMYLNFAFGLAPKATHVKYIDLKSVDLKAKAGPSSAVACHICAGMAAMQGIKIILNKGTVKPAPYFSQFDPFSGKYRHGHLWLGNRNPVQQIKKALVKYFLARKDTKPGFEACYAPATAVDKENVPDKVIRYLVKMGTLAPSADNCQPWRFFWDGSALNLYPDPERTGFFYDVQEESTLITFGAVLENIRIAATRFGLFSTFAYPSADEAELSIKIKFKQNKVPEDDLFSYLPFRTTNRRPYTGKAIDKKVKTNLYSSINDFPKNSLHIYEDKKTKAIFNKIIFDADRILFEDKRLHQGLFHWVRMHKCSSARDGMDLGVLELGSLPQRLTFPLFGSWKVLSIGNYLGMSRIPGINSLILLKSTPAYCLITSRNRDRQGYLESGRALERFWIEANLSGMAVQPMAGFVFLINHYIHDQARQFSEKHKLMIEKMKERLDSLLGPREVEYPVMFFRVGYAQAPAKKSPRRSLADILAFDVAHKK